MEISSSVGAGGQVFDLLFTGTPFGRSLLSTSCFDPATLAETSSASAHTQAPPSICGH